MPANVDWSFVRCFIFSTRAHAGYVSWLPCFNPSRKQLTPIAVGEHVITQKSLYTILFVIGIPLLWWAEPFSTLFYIVGASLVLIISHASLIEPGVESEYAEVEGQV